MLKNDIKRRLNNLAKPKGSLGYLEEIAIKMAMIQGRVIPELPRRKAVYVFAGDHGIVEEGISAFPKEVTAQMVFNFLKGGAAINVFSRHVGSEVFVVDAGVDFDFPESPGLLKMKIGRGTRNFLKETAMTRKKAKCAIDYGKKVARHAIDRKVDLIAVGDMGIGNTTTATAIATAFGYKLEDIIDIGTVVSKEQLEKKEKVVRKAMEIHSPFKDPIDVLSKVGGFCFGEIAGFILECANNRLPVVLDGFPTTAAALIAYNIDQKVVDFMFAGHKSKVKGHSVILNRLKLRPILDLDMRLGEGTGAVLSFSIIEAAIHMIREMTTFDDANIVRGNEL
ncbi:MAG: nicotinate-nucleotide--dimethylbenzimidazole phosphoribosyltransferase [Thermotoga sp.]|nr:MAG: nicotinate-nucleotide--dimethylbenzimidazole phosphoribosyltransferase [Thermotoga sp.]